MAASFTCLPALPSHKQHAGLHSMTMVFNQLIMLIMFSDTENAGVLCWRKYRIKDVDGVLIWWAVLHHCFLATRTNIWPLTCRFFGGKTSFIHLIIKQFKVFQMCAYILGFKGLKDGLSAAGGKLSFCWNREILKEATRMLLYVLPELRRSVKYHKRLWVRLPFPV